MFKEVWFQKHMHYIFGTDFHIKKILPSSSYLNLFIKVINALNNPSTRLLINMNIICVTSSSSSTSYDFWYRFLLQILRSHVMVRVGGGWDTLSHYLDKHDPCRCRAQHRAAVAARLIPRTNNQSNGIELHKAQVIFER